jgi:hypothetical protein
MLGLLCTISFAASLVIAVNPYPPGPSYIEWSLCIVLLVASAGLWLHKRWARVAFLLAGIIFFFRYAAEIMLAPGDCAGNLVGCYKYYILSSRVLAATYYLSRFICSTESVQCYTACMWLTPALTIAALAILIKPMAAMPRLLPLAVAATSLGLVIPVAIALIHYDVDLMWWPPWINFVWPTNFLLVVTHDIFDGFFFAVAAISVAINALLYALVAVLLSELSARIAGHTRSDSASKGA